LQNGVTKEEIGELITHLAFYAGWPAAMTAALVAKDVFEKMFTSGRAAGDIVAADGLTQIGDASELSIFVEEVLRSNDDAVAVYRGGKTTTLGFLVGQVMKKAGGKANPKLVNELLKRALDHE